MFTVPMILRLLQSALTQPTSTGLASSRDSVEFRLTEHFIMVTALDFFRLPLHMDLGDNGLMSRTQQHQKFESKTCVCSGGGKYPIA